MRTYEIIKAGSVGQEVPPDTTIVIAGEPDERKTLRESKIFYGMQARKIADALYESLPGGTLDHLVAEMMQRQASLLMVRL